MYTCLWKYISNNRKKEKCYIFCNFDYITKEMIEWQEV